MWKEHGARQCSQGQAQCNLGLCLDSSKPGSGPDLSLPADFLTANYCTGTNASFWVMHRGPDTAPVIPLSTHSVRQQEKDVRPPAQHLTQAQPDIHLDPPQHVPTLSALFMPQ